MAREILLALGVLLHSSLAAGATTNELTTELERPKRASITVSALGVSNLYKADAREREANGRLTFVPSYKLGKSLRVQAYLGVDIGFRRFFVSKSSAIAGQVAGNYQVVNLLGTLSEEQIKKVLSAEKLDGLTEVEKAAKALGNETIQKFVDGGFQQPSFYAMMIQSLAKYSN